MLWLGIVRSPHAHARLVKIDGREALRLPGVVAVLTREDMPELGGSVPPLVPAPTFPSCHHPVLAAGAVKHVGEGVAVVAAETPYVAADAVERVVVEYEPLAAAASPEAALAPGAPKVNDDWPGNLAGISETHVGDARSGFAGAEVTVEMRLHYPRVGGMPIEPRGVLATHDAATGLLTVWCSTQVPFGVRSGIAAVLAMAEEHVRVIAPDVGGGFGIGTELVLNDWFFLPIPLVPTPGVVLSQGSASPKSIICSCRLCRDARQNSGRPIWLRSPAHIAISSLILIPILRIVLLSHRSIQVPVVHT